MNVDMTWPLSLAKITEAITSLPKGKALGHDGIPTKLFHEYVNEVAPMLLLAFKAMLAGIDLGIHQQGHDHLNSKVKGPLKTWELAPNHTFGEHI